MVLKAFHVDITTLHNTSFSPAAQAPPRSSCFTSSNCFALEFRATTQVLLLSHKGFKRLQKVSASENCLSHLLISIAWDVLYHLLSHLKVRLGNLLQARQEKWRLCLSFLPSSQHLQPRVGKQTLDECHMWEDGIAPCCKPPRGHLDKCPIHPSAEKVAQPMQRERSNMRGPVLAASHCKHGQKTPPGIEDCFAQNKPSEHQLQRIPAQLSKRNKCRETLLL